MFITLRLVALSTLLGLVVSTGRSSAAETLIPYPRVPGDRPNADVTVRVNGTPIEATSLELNVGYAHFAFSGTARVEIVAKQPIQQFNLSPHRYGIAAKVDGNTLSFELTEPRKLHLQIDGLPRFFLFADALEASPPQPGQPGVFDLRTFKVTSSPDAIQTAQLQQALDEVAAKKGTLYVPAGIYRSGQLRLPSDLSLYVAPGAIIKGTGRIEDYPRGEFGTQQIDLLDCRNVRIFGRGVIDGQGRALRLSTQNSSLGRCKLIRSHRADDCVVEDMILRDSGTWGIHLIESTDLRFSNFKLISNTIRDDPKFPWEPNTDGFDPDNSSRVLIENGFVSCNDDAIALKLRYGKRRDMDDVCFRNNVVWTVKSALKIGSEVAECRLTNAVFENNEVVSADRGIVVYGYFGGTIADCRWLGNHFEFIGGDLKRMHVEIKIQDEEGRGHVQDLLIKDNAFEREAENGSKVQGLDAEHLIRGVTFENLTIAGRRCTNLAEARINTPRHAERIEVK